MFLANKILFSFQKYDFYTKAMLHMNGTDGSTTFKDEILKVWTANGNAQIDTAQSKFGGASGLFDGSGDWIDTPDNEDFNIGNGDFTVDCWIKRSTIGTFQRICGQQDNAGTVTSISMQFKFNNSNYISWTGYQGSSGYTVQSTNPNTSTNWQHLAVVRYGNTITLYIDGVASGTVDVTGVTFNNSSNKFAIGRSGEHAVEYFNGWIDEFRFSKGKARWTSNFTPPTSEY